ncbi:ABC-type phosphate/phosphonate transport system, periplasmic component [Sulfitobacter donghicola DSW-25 = KCTC 12864 = JCM 14565]|nr:PhnD/SsuA/transferrin family substrate-binding protein [Sulfitobacter donghicola]KIN67608.1 ABC-type phosphate/phosphonate transport system, periplasmic component [Sulfitobacter donghicola DSW-25 = KCTC 12864 = JCM 14565]
MMMYSRPELETANNLYWQTIRANLFKRGINAPATLAQTAGEFAVWKDPDMVFSQTCGMPFRTKLKDTVQLVGTPDYGLEGCPAGYYNSAIVIRQDDPRADLHDYQNARFAFNMNHSQSGYAAIYTHLQPYGFWFKNRIASGGHLRSAQMVAEGEADIASLDAQTWRLIQRYESFSEHLRVIEHTAPTPGLPYITNANLNPQIVFDAVQEAINELPSDIAQTLDLKGLVLIPKETYLSIPTPPAVATV